MLLVRSLVFNVLLFTILLVMGILCLPLAAWSRAGARASMRAYSRLMLWLLKVVCGLRTEIRGPIPTDDVLIAAKHQSFLDIMMMVAVLPRFQFIMKRELRWTPVIGLYAIRIGSTPVARGDRGKAMKAMVQRVAAHSGPRRQLVIYPQGTRVAPGVQAPYKIGAGVLYERMGLPCVPAATNVGVFWGRSSFWRRPGLGVVEFLEPIPPGLPLRDFMRRLEAEVEARSDALMREEGFTRSGHE